ncbi:MAG: ATPase [Alphaproteobacteria bacterium]|nr:ATPase [Alphaproteobacteria bacterium]
MSVSNLAITLIGMSGVGKTHLAEKLRHDGWFHYSADYRIGTRYIDEKLLDGVKRRMMQDPFLAAMLRSDSIFVGQNISMHNLALVSAFIGLPGDPAQGGMAMEAFLANQRAYADGERMAADDLPFFITRARDIYGYQHFVHDSTGSLCEIIDTTDPQDPIWENMRQHTTLVWIQDSDADRDALIVRQQGAPKPIYYNEGFFHAHFEQFCRDNGDSPSNPTFAPKEFLIYVFPHVVARRRDRYAALVANDGITISSDEVAAVRDTQDMVALLQSKQ